MKKVAVCCAVIARNDKILLTQRSEHMSLPLLWEFPGGKLEPYESKEECLIREIKEELLINIQIHKPLKSVEHLYGSTLIVLYPFLCSIVKGTITLTEHSAYQWITIEQMSQLEMAPADIPIFNELNTIWKQDFTSR